MDERMLAALSERGSAHIFKPEAQPVLAQHFRRGAQASHMQIEILLASDIIAGWREPGGYPIHARLPQCLGATGQRFERGTEFLLGAPEIDRQARSAPGKLLHRGAVSRKVRITQAEKEIP